MTARTRTCFALSAALTLLAAIVGCGPRGEAIKPLAPEVDPATVIRLPDDHDPEQGCPLLVALHGHDQTEEQVPGIWDEGLFYLPNFILLSVRAPFDARDGYSWFGSSDDPAAGAVESRRASALTGEQVVLDAIAAAEEEYSIDPEARYLLGISQGASVALFIALRHPDLFAGVATLAGRLNTGVTAPVTEATAGGLEVFLGLGRGEGPEAVELAEQTADEFRAAGADVRLDIHDEGHVLKAEQVRAMQNFLGLARTRAPEDDRIYNRNGTLATPPQPEATWDDGSSDDYEDEYYYDEGDEYEDYGDEEEGDVEY